MELRSGRADGGAAGAPLAGRPIDRLADALARDAATAAGVAESLCRRLALAAGLRDAATLRPVAARIAESLRRSRRRPDREHRA